MQRKLPLRLLPLFLHRRTASSSAASFTSRQNCNTAAGWKHQESTIPNFHFNTYSSTTTTTTTTKTNTNTTEEENVVGERLPYPYNRFEHLIPDDAREMLLKRERMARQTQRSERNEQDFRTAMKTMADIYTVHLPHYVSLASVKHPGTEIQEQTTAAREAIEQTMREANTLLSEMKQRLGVARVDDLVKLVSQEQGKRIVQDIDESSADDNTSTRGAVLENLTNYGWLFAQQVMSQYIDETVKNPTAKLRYSEMVIDKIISRIDNEQFLMTAGTMFGDMGEHTLGIKVFKRLRDLEPDNVINLYNLALQYEAKGMYEHAIGSYKKLHEDGKLPNRISLIKLSKCHESIGAFHEAAKYHKQYAQLLLDTLKESSHSESNGGGQNTNVTISGQSRGVNEQESVEVLLDLGYLHTMAEEFEEANKTFRMALDLFPHHSIIAYQWLVSMRSQQRFVDQTERQLQHREKEEGSVLKSAAENSRIEQQIATTQSDIEQSLQQVKEFLTNLREISMVNKVLVDLCKLQVSILEQRPTKECWEHAVEACNHASTRDNQELVVFELTNFLYDRKYSGKFDDFKSSYNAFLLQFISQETEIFTDNISLWSRLRKLTGKPCNVDDARSVLLVLRIEDHNTQETTFRKYHLVAHRDKEERQVQFAVDFEALIQKEIVNKEIVIHECQATLALDENVLLENGSESEVYTGIFNVGPLLEKDAETEAKQAEVDEPTTTDQ